MCISPPTPEVPPCILHPKKLSQVFAARQFADSSSSILENTNRKSKFREDYQFVAFNGSGTRWAGVSISSDSKGSSLTDEMLKLHSLRQPPLPPRLEALSTLVCCATNMHRGSKLCRLSRGPQDTTIEMN